MADFTKRISVIIDVAAQSARTQLANLKTDIAQADGFFGKLKVAGGGALNFIKGNAALMAGGVAAAGAGIAKFAVNAVGDFTKAALAADKLRNATGLSLDESSRWIAVADDIGISAETLQGAFIKMEKQLGTNKQAFAEYGVEVAKNKDGTTDLNTTLLNAIDRIQKIKDPTDRAAASAKLFGKGFAEVSELINTSSADIRKSMKSVSDEQLFTEEEVRKAKEYRAAVDNLKDSTGDLALKAGGSLAPALTQVAETAADTVEGLVAVGEAIGGLNEKATRFGVDVLGLLSSGWKQLYEHSVKAFDGKNPFGSMESDAKNAASAVGEVFGPVQESAAQAEARAIGEVEDAYKSLMDEIDESDAALDLADAFDKVNDAAQEAWDAASSGAEDAEGKGRDYQRAVNDLKRDVINYGQKVKELPTSVVTAINTLIDKGQYDAANFALRSLSAPQAAQINAIANTQGAAAAIQALITRYNNNVISLQIQAKGGAGYNTAGTRGYASGTEGAPPGWAWTGEDGPELLKLPAGAKVRNAARSRQMVSGAPNVTNITINNPTGSDPTRTNRELERYARRNGSRT